MLIKKIRINGGRNWIGNKKLAHIVWDEHNPDNPWEPGYTIHHKDKNPLNDEPENLDKLTNSQHRHLHNLGNQNNKGKVFSEEWHSNMSKSRLGNKNKLGKKHSDEFCKQISDRMKGNSYSLGFIHSEETRKKLSEIHKGQIPWIKGKTHSEESKIKISLATKGDKNPFYGKKHSEETRKKISESKKKSKKVEGWMK